MKKNIFLLLALTIMLINSVSALSIFEPTQITRDGEDAGQSGYRGMQWFSGGAEDLGFTYIVKVTQTTCDTGSIIDMDTGLWIANGTFVSNNASVGFIPITPYHSYGIVVSPSSGQGTCSVSYDNSIVPYNVSTMFGNYTNSLNDGTPSTSNAWTVQGFGVTLIDYPVFSNQIDNSGIRRGEIANFMVDIANFNGTAILNINDQNFTASISGATANVTTNISVIANGDNLVAGITYPYKWIAAGTGLPVRYNETENRDYTVLDSNTPIDLFSLDLGNLPAMIITLFMIALSLIAVFFNPTRFLGCCLLFILGVILCRSGYFIFGLILVGVSAILAYLVRE